MMEKSTEAINHEHRSAMIVAAGYEAGDVISIDRLLTKRAQIARVLLAGMDNNGDVEVYYNVLAYEINRALGIVPSTH